MQVNIALIVGGFVCIAVAIWGKKFGAADVEGFPINDNKETSTWSGKLVFGAVGIGFVIIGILRLLGHG
jgi:hypothetical protein